MGKAVIVADCSYGFARFTAINLKDRGYEVHAITDSPKVKQELEEKGITAYQLDLGKSKDVRLVCDNILTKCKEDPYGIILYVGYTQIGAIQDISREALEEQFEKMVFGPIEFLSYFLPIFRKNNGGRVIFINTLNGRFTFPFMSAYGSARRALESFFESLEREYSKTGVKVMNIVPFCLKQDSDQHAKIVNHDKKDVVLQDIYKKIYNMIEEITDAKGSENIINKTYGEIVKGLEDDKVKKRSVIGIEAKIRDFFHTHLPPSILDYLLEKRLKTHYNIDINELGKKQ